MNEIRNSDNHLVGITYRLVKEQQVLLEIVRKDCVTQFIWPLGVDVEIVNKKMNS